jgi:polyhydroxyalkanoate synthase subunit PhaC
MTTTSSSLGHFTQSSFPFYDNTFVDVSNAFARALSNTNRFNITLCDAFADSFSIYFNTISEYNKSWKDLSELDKILRNRFRKAFDEKFREENFVNALSDTISSYSELASVTGLGEMYRHLSNTMSAWNNDFIEPIRDTLLRTPSEKACEIDKYSLFHYNRPSTAVTEKENGLASQNNTPVLVIYAFINRHYILDLLPEVSVIRSLLSHGLDIFATDWGHHLQMIRV